MYMSQEMPNLRRFLARFWLRGEYEKISVNKILL